MLKTIRKIGAWLIIIVTIILVVSAISADAAITLWIVLPIMLSILFSWGIGMLILEKIFS